MSYTLKALAGQLAAAIDLLQAPDEADEAAHTAAGMLPPAIEVKAMDDCTVDGSAHRNSTPT